MTKKVKKLVDQLLRGKLSVQNSAVVALGQMGPEAAGAVPVLMTLLRDEWPILRRHTAWSLGQIGPGASAAVPLLAAALDDRVWQVRQAAAGPLARIDPAAWTWQTMMRPVSVQS